MLRTYEPSGKVGTLAALTLPLAAALLIGAAFGYQWVLFNVHIRKLHFIWLIAAILFVGAVAYLALRFGKVRSIGLGILLGFGFGLLFELSTFWMLFLIDDHGSAAGKGFTEYLSFRKSEGYRLSKSGSATISGWVLVALWLVEGFGMTFAGLVGGVIAGSRPFCEACGRWAGRKIWKFEVAGVSDSVCEGIKNAQSFEATMQVPPGAPGGNRLQYELAGCPCGQTAVARVAQFKAGSDDDTELVADILVGSHDTERLFSWAEARNPAMIGKRPKLDLRIAPQTPTSAASGPIPRELEKLPSGDPKSFDRLGRNTTAYSMMSCDNSMTRELRSRLDDNNFEAAKEALRGHKDANDLAFVVEACSDWSADAPQFLAAWEQAEPDSAAFHLVRGTHAIKWAWSARGAGWTPKDYPEFQRRLEFAEAQLLHATSKAPRDPTAWANLIVVARGRSRPEDGRRAFSQAVERSPDHYLAHSAMLINLMSKWHGSTEEMFAFARATAARAKAGSVLPVIVVEAHLERSLEVWRDTGKGGKQAAAEYWKSPAVQAEVRSACAKTFGGGAHKVGMLTPMARAKFAWALWKCGDREGAAEQMRIIGPNTPWGPFTPALLPWGLMPGSYGAARRQCGA